MWENAVKTTRGLALDKKLLNGNVKLNITKAAAGVGRVDLDQLANQVSLKNRVWDLELGTMGKLEGEITLPIRLRNIGLTEMFALQQIGIYVEDLNEKDPGKREILYVIAQITDEMGVEIPSEAESPGYVMQWNFIVNVPGTDTVKVKVNPAVSLTPEQGDARYAMKGAIPDSAPVAAKLLWSGTWSNGTITVPGINQYEIIMVEAASKNRILCTKQFSGKNPAYWIGISGFHGTSAHNTRTVILSTSGANFETLGIYANSPFGELAHTASGSHGALQNFAVTAIYGVVAQGVSGVNGSVDLTPYRTSTVQDTIDNAKQPKITATGATNVLTAPATAGGQPGIKPIAELGGNGANSCPYAIGDVYITLNSNDPATRWMGTTWERMAKNAVLVGVDESISEINAAGKPVGSNTKAITVNQMPAHTHPGPSHTHTTPNHTHAGGAAASAGAHTHGPTTGDNFIYGTSGGTHSITQGSGSSTYGQTGSTTSAGAHTHTVTVTSSGGGTTGADGTEATGNAGGADVFDVRQAGVAVYIWKRTA